MATRGNWDIAANRKAIYTTDREGYFVKENERKRLKRVIGLFFGLLVCFLPVIGVMGIRYGADAYSKKRSVTVDDCVVKSVVEASGEILFAVELPGQEPSSLPEMRVVYAYKTREKNQRETAVGDTVICSFPERNTGLKGYVVW